MPAIDLIKCLPFIHSCGSEVPDIDYSICHQNVEKVLRFGPSAFQMLFILDVPAGVSRVLWDSSRGWDVLKDMHQSIDVQICDLKPNNQDILKNTPLRVSTPFSWKSKIPYQDLSCFERPSKREVTWDEGIYTWVLPKETNTS